MEKDVVLTVITERNNLNNLAQEALEELFADEGENIADFDISDALGDGICDDETEVSEMITEGKMKCDGEGNVELYYEETEISGMEGSVCRIVYNEGTPELVSMIREGSVNTVLSFEPRKRHMSTYITPFMPFDICINTVNVENHLKDEGFLMLDYYIEVRGLNAEHTKVTVKIS